MQLPGTDRGAAFLKELLYECFNPGQAHCKEI